MTLTYLGNGLFAVRNFDKVRNATRHQLTALGKNVENVADRAEHQPGEPLQIPRTRNPEPRNKRMYSNIVQ